MHTLYHSHTEQISQNFPNMSTMTGCSVTEGMDISNIFKKLQAGDGIEGILAFSDKYTLKAIARVKQFRD